jgi:uncharacterized membrane protein
MNARKTTRELLGASSHAVSAVIIAIMVFELKTPDGATFSALLSLRSMEGSYAVSCVFIAIIWLNHLHLLRFVDHTA